MNLDNVDTTPPSLDAAAEHLPTEVWKAVRDITKGVDRIVQTMKPLMALDKADDTDQRQPAIECAAASLTAVSLLKRNLIGPLEQALTELLVKLTRYGEHPEVAGLGRLWISARKKKTFDHELIISNLAARLADELPVDRDTGEVRPPADVINQTVRITAEACGATAPSFTGWRTKVLGTHGVKLDRHATEERTGLHTARFE